MDDIDVVKSLMTPDSPAPILRTRRRRSPKILEKALVRDRERFPPARR